ncbi:MAG TPA: zf-HC2 domain-containing protein [Armatimonadota bacterium]|nr:zf-HC2 domain-containing protein [Armatimonadota bacterium]
MLCFRIRKRLIPYIEGTLDERTSKAVENHVARCPRCAEELALVQKASDAIRSIKTPAQEPDQDLWSRIEREINTVPTPTQMAWRARGLQFAGTAVAAVVVIAVVINMNWVGVGKQPTHVVTVKPPSAGSILVDPERFTNEELPDKTVEKIPPPVEIAKAPTEVFTRKHDYSSKSEVIEHSKPVGASSKTVVVHSDKPADTLSAEVSKDDVAFGGPGKVGDAEPSDMVMAAVQPTEDIDIDSIFKDSDIPPSGAKIFGSRSTGAIVNKEVDDTKTEKSVDLGKLTLSGPSLDEGKGLAAGGITSQSVGAIASTCLNSNISILPERVRIASLISQRNLAQIDVPCTSVDLLNSVDERNRNTALFSYP